MGLYYKFVHVICFNIYIYILVYYSLEVCQIDWRTNNETFCISKCDRFSSWGGIYWCTNDDWGDWNLSASVICPPTLLPLEEPTIASIGAPIVFRHRCVGFFKCFILTFGNLLLIVSLLCSSLIPDDTTNASLFCSSVLLPGSLDDSDYIIKI